jgi:hypothetical protein
MAADRLGIVAGGGPLPRRLVEACRRDGRGVFVLAFRGQTDEDGLDGVPHIWSRLGAVGDNLKALREAGVVELCLAGRFRRPSLTEIRPDWRGAAFLARVGFQALGDDALLQALRRELEEREGFRLVGPHEVLGDLLAEAGCLTRVAPDEAAEADIRRGLEVARALGRLDVGQGAVVQEGVVLAVEAAEGTDAMVRRCAGLKRAGPGGVLVKARKPQQDDRLDLPTIGLDTVAQAAAAGLRGIAVEAGAALVVDRDALAEAADRAGLFVIALEPEAGGP